MHEFSTLGSRIKYGLSHAGKTQADLSRYVGIKTATVSQWCSDKVKALKSDNALKVSRFLGVNYDWLVTGKGTPEEKDVVALGDNEPAPDGYVQIPEYAIYCAAGHGYTPSYEELTDVEPATYRESFFTSRHINPKSCKRLCVMGDSMEPTLFAGDKILVNLDDKKIVDRHVYVINVGEEVRVKRLVRRLNGDIVIKSDNPEYDDEVIDVNLPEDSCYFSIIGRVIDKSGGGGL